MNGSKGIDAEIRLGATCWLLFRKRERCILGLGLYRANDVVEEAITVSINLWHMYGKTECGS